MDRCLRRRLRLNRTASPFDLAAGDVYSGQSKNNVISNAVKNGDELHAYLMRCKASEEVAKAEKGAEPHELTPAQREVKRLLGIIEAKLSAQKGRGKREYEKVLRVVSNLENIRYAGGERNGERALSDEFIAFVLEEYLVKV